MATIRNVFPHEIDELENVWIPLADGTRLAARIWLPKTAVSHPVPALLEYLPYRKNDGTAVRDARRQPYFAGHGYAAIRVDMRGSGDADGILHDEYLRQEQDDGLEILDWIAAQPWCNGNIGMHGISWGGFNSLQIAARQPPQLKCLLVIGFTDDRYHDDVHYMGGCLLTQQMLSWGSVMFAYNAAPPDPRFVGDRWREMWHERLEKTPPWAETWIAHQRRDAYWQHGSICENYDAIQIPVFAVGGWADSYNNSIPRLLQNLTVPRKGLIGPWCHTFPEVGEPAPAIGFLQESLRWFDYWLKGEETGIMAEPMLRTWLQDSVPPANFYAERPGKWVADPSWPSPHVGEQLLYLNGRSLDPQPQPKRRRRIKGIMSCGLDSGEWGAYGIPGEYPGDQRAADGQSLTFTSEPVAADIAILGYPTLRLHVAADRPHALVAVRLCDVAPTGESTLVSWGLLNLTHRHSHDQPDLLTPGEFYEVDIPLRLCAATLPAGHRWRVSLSPTFVRHAWPSPQRVTLTVLTGTSQLILPVRTPHSGDEQLAPFPPAEHAPPLPINMLRSASRRQVIERDLVGNWVTFKTDNDGGREQFPDGLEIDDQGTEEMRFQLGDPLSVRVAYTRHIEYRRGNWQVQIATECAMWCDADSFFLHHQLQGLEAGEVVFEKSWERTIPRDFC